MEEGTLEMASQLRDIYECDYPLRQIRWLRTLCTDTYGGSVSEMRRQYLTPTMNLLKRMKDLSFPLANNNGVIVHLFPPRHNLTIGEFYFQTSKSCPGELALKFTKYSTKDEQHIELAKPRYEVQFTTIADEDLPKVFALSYLEHLRTIGKEKKGTKRTSVSLRLCVVSKIKEDVSDVIDSEDIMPANIEENLNNMNDDEVVSQKITKLPQFVEDLTTSQIRALAAKMDPINAIGDYQKLANCLEFSWKEIVEHFKYHPSPTQELITVLQQKYPKYSVSDIVGYLSQMNRKDAILAMCDAEEMQRRISGRKPKLGKMPVQESREESSPDNSPRNLEPSESDETEMQTALGIENTGAANTPPCNESCSGDSLHHDIHKQFAQPESTDSGEMMDGITLMGALSINDGASLLQPPQNAYLRKPNEAVTPLATGQGIEGTDIKVTGQYIRGNDQINHKDEERNGVANGYKRGNPNPTAEATGHPSMAVDVAPPVQTGADQYKRENRAI